MLKKKDKILTMKRNNRKEVQHVIVLCSYSLAKFSVESFRFNITAGMYHHENIACLDYMSDCKLLQLVSFLQNLKLKPISDTMLFYYKNITIKSLENGLGGVFKEILYFHKIQII